ncbi:MAG: hypothetical protein AAF050_22455, partial [Cyanobacteria bacterium J06649_5]
QASKVAQGRALRIEGQTYIAEWEDRIEIIEDQPIMNAAQTLAAAGDLDEAIVEAQKVAEGRALRADAQTAIKGWVEEIQTIEDQPILIRAENFAARGRLTDAIATAALIGPGRALSDEAEVSIAIWAKERAYIWSLEAPAPEPYEGGYDVGYSDDIYNSDSFLDYGE